LRNILSRTLILLFTLLSSTLLFAQSQATKPPESGNLFPVTGDWKASVFGDVGGPDVITADNFGITEKKDSIVLSAKNDKGKIASGSEGVVYYYQEVQADKDFELSAQVTVGSFAKNNQVSFGIMFRDKVLVNQAAKNDLGNYLAVGPTNLATKTALYTFQRTDAGFARNGEISKSPPLAPGISYKINFKKTGSSYQLKWGDEDSLSVSDINFVGEKRYIGFFAARNATVTISDIQFETGSKNIVDLRVDAKNMKSSYFVGDQVNLKGLTVQALYDNGQKKLLTPDDYSITSFDSVKPGSFEFELSSSGITKKIAYKVLPLTCTALSIRFFPLKTDYTKLDTFDPTGIVVNAIYNNGYKTVELLPEQFDLVVAGKPAVNYEFTKSGSIPVTVQSKEAPKVSVSFPVNVKEAPISGLVIGSQPVKTRYFLGDTLDLHGLVVFAQYGDGTRIRLGAADYAVSGFDSKSPGPKTVSISHKGKNVALSFVVNQKKAEKIQIDRLPKTTYNVGSSFDPKDLVVSLVYDNGDKEPLAAGTYSVDSSKLDFASTGLFEARIVPVDQNLKPVAFNVSVRKAVTQVWNSTFFGQSTKEATNMVKVLPDGAVKVIALEGGGKVTGDHDGISYYYTELDAVNDNFELYADVTVTEYAKVPWDGQEAFGIMARDAIGAPGDASVFASNMVGVGGYSASTKGANGTQMFVRTGVTSPDGKGSLGVKRTMFRNEKPDVTNTEPAKAYRLYLAKTNSGFVARLNTEAEAFAWEPDILSVQNKKMYVGFFTARLATIEIRNITLHVSDAKADAVKTLQPPEPITPQLDIFSLDKTAQTDYSLRAVANVSGSISVKQGLKTLVSDKAVKAGSDIVIPAVLESNQTVPFTLDLIPDDTQLLTTTEPLVKTWEVSMKTFVPDGDIVVAPDGLVTGTGTPSSPLDLETALAYVRPGQKIILKDGRYNRVYPLVVPKYHDGKPGALKSLVAADGAKPIIDFGKRSAGFTLGGNYWLIKGIDFTNTAGNSTGFGLGGSNNILDGCRFYANGDTGLTVGRVYIQDVSFDSWPANNLIVRCESFDNRDPSDNNADGFAAKLTIGNGNVFRDCVSHNNADDGYDFYTKVGFGPIGALLIDHCVAYRNGTLSDGTVTKGDKNGFKMGGEGIGVTHLARNCLSFNNGATGFTNNSNPAIQLENDFSYDNAGANLALNTYTGVAPQFKISGFHSYRTTKGVNDWKLNDQASETNYTFEGDASTNVAGTKLTLEAFLSDLEKANFPRSILEKR